MKNWEDVKRLEYKADPDWKTESRWVLLIVKKEMLRKRKKKTGYVKTKKMRKKKPSKNPKYQICPSPLGVQKGKGGKRSKN